jgi:hypothetical protein
MKSCALKSTLLLAALAGCRTSPAPLPLTGQAQIVAIVRSGDGLAWGAELERLAHGEENAASAAAVGQLLADPAPAVRMRAATTLGAIGPGAVAQAPGLRRLLDDPSAEIRAEGAFALGAVRAADSATLDALYRLRQTDKVAVVTARAQTAMLQLLTRGGIAPSASFEQMLRSELRATSQADRDNAISLAELVTAPWKLEALRPLLVDPLPWIRDDAAWAIAHMGHDGAPARSDLAHLAGDSARWVRDDVPDMLATMDSSIAPALPACVHRRIDSTGNGKPAVIPAELVVLPTSRSLHDDGRGPYRTADGVSAGHAYSYNLMLPYSLADRLGQVGGDSLVRGHESRWIAMDFSDPVDVAGKGLGVVRDSTLHLGIFFMHDARGYIWNTRDIPIGARVRSDHTGFLITIAGKPHLFQFGPWALRVCGQRFGSANGEGTSQITIDRLSAGEFRVTAPVGSRGRLWDYSVPMAARDLGLFRFSFDAIVRAVP